MANYFLLDTADHRLDEIFQYTLGQWGLPQAEQYIEGLFACFEAIANQTIVWRSIPARYQVEGYFARYEKHYIFFRDWTNGDIGIVSILHKGMHHMQHLAEEFGQLTDEN